MSVPSHWLSSLLQKADDDAPGKASLVVASTSSVDRQDDIVEQDWELDDYAKNPVILWGHRYDLAPVGRALGVKVENGKLLASIAWDEDSEMGKAVARQVRDGFLNAVSVGFYPGQSIPRRSLPDGDPRKKDGYGYIHSKNKLLEISVVPVPANAEALFVTRSAGLADAATIRACMAKGLPVPGRDGEVLEVLLAEVRREVGAAGVAALIERVGALEKALEAMRPAPDADPWASWGFGEERGGDSWAKWFEG
jgi:HK97 family phage prohead protease